MIASDATVSLVSFYIDGAWERPTDRSGGAIVNPATGGAIAEVPYADAADIDRAVRAAHRGVPQMARRAGGGPRAGAVPLQGAARKAPAATWPPP